MEEFRAAIDAKYKLHRHAFATCNLDLLLTSFFHKDAVWSGPYPEPDTVFRGRSELHELFSHVIDNQIVTKIESFDSYVDGNTGWDLIVYQTDVREGYTGSENSVATNWRTAFLWIKDGGEWLVKGVHSYKIGER